MEEAQIENASKALLIARAILLCILIIAIGMFIYNSTQSTIVDSLSTLSTQEIEAYNNQFLAYQGIQKGINIKKLIRMIFAMQDGNLKESLYFNPISDILLLMPIFVVFECWGAWRPYIFKSCSSNWQVV